jgi:hypothetical protein
MHNTKDMKSTLRPSFFRDWGIRGALNRLQNSGSYGSRGPLARLAGLPANEQLERFVKKFRPLKLRQIFDYKILGEIFVRQVA